MLSALAHRALDRAGLGPIRDKVLARERLTEEEALQLYLAKDLAAIGALANHVREQRHGDLTFYNRNVHLPFATASFDAATVVFGMRNLDSHQQGLAELARVIRPGGRMGILEFFRPETTQARLVHGLYNRLALPLLGRLFSADGSAYRYLVESMERFASRSEFEQSAHQVGFADVQGETLFPGVCGLVLAVRKAGP